MGTPTPSRANREEATEGFGSLIKAFANVRERRVGVYIPGLNSYPVLCKRRRLNGASETQQRGLLLNTLRHFVEMCLCGSSTRWHPSQITLRPFPAIWPISKTCDRHPRGSPVVPETSENEKRGRGPAYWWSLHSLCAQWAEREGNKNSCETRHCHSWELRLEDEWWKGFRWSPTVLTAGDHHSGS